MIVTINQDNDVWCQNDNSDKVKCDVLRMYDECAECGNCPILAMFERYERLKFGLDYDDAE